MKTEAVVTSFLVRYSGRILRPLETEILELLELGRTMD
jgi:hypothetical protein